MLNLADTRRDYFFGLFVNHGSLLLLTLSTSALTLTMRYSRTVPGPRYLTSTVVVLSEALKFLLSTAVYVCTRSTRPARGIGLLEKLEIDVGPQSREIALEEIAVDLFGRRSGFFLLLIPSGLYTITNNLQFIAASNLDAATYQVAYQGKLITTAVFAVIIMQQKLTVLKWLSIPTLALGVACVSLPESTSSFPPAISPVAPAIDGSKDIGLIAVAVSCGLSGLASVSFDFVLKRYRTPSESKDKTCISIWLRNSQLSFGGLILAFSGALLWHGHQIRQDGFFYGHSYIVWLTVLLQAFTGIVVSLVIASADNILKGFATSLSTLLSTFISVYYFNVVVTPNFLYGAVLVLFSIHMYGLPD